MLGTKFKLSVDLVQLLKVITFFYLPYVASLSYTICGIVLNF